MHWVFTQTEISNYFYYLKFQTIQNTTQSHQHISIYTIASKVQQLLQTSVCLSQLARIHRSSLINIKKILNGPITKFYNCDDVNVIATELRLYIFLYYKKRNLL